MWRCVLAGLLRGLSAGGAFPCGFISCDVFLGFLMVFVLLRAVFRLSCLRGGAEGQVFLQPVLTLL